MRTPRVHASSRSRAAGTLIDNGFLREAPRSLPFMLRYAGRSALRKCIFLPEAPDLVKRALREADLLPPRQLPDAPKASPRPTARPEDQSRSIEPRRSAPAEAPRASSMLDAPLVVGALLFLLPPVGVAILWTSKRYGADARWALTAITALTMCLAAVVAVAAFLA